MTQNKRTLPSPSCTKGDDEIGIQMDVSAIKRFEKRGMELLKKLDVKNDRGQPIASMPMHAGMILGNYLRISDILEAAVGPRPICPIGRSVRGCPRR